MQILGLMPLRQKPLRVLVYLVASVCLYVLEDVVLLRLPLPAWFPPVLQVILSLTLAYIGVEMANNPPGTSEHTKMRWRIGVFVVATTVVALSVYQAKDQTRKDKESAQTIVALTNQVTSLTGEVTGVRSELSNNVVQLQAKLSDSVKTLNALVVAVTTNVNISPDMQARVFDTQKQFADVDFDRDRFICKFVCLGELHGQAEIQAKTEPPFPKADLAERVEFEFLGEEELTRELRNALSLSSGITGECRLFAAGKRSGRSSIIDLTAEGPLSGPSSSVVLVVAATQLVALFDQYKSSLFTLNIRNYLGNTTTNKMITDTLRKEPTHFYYYNNGIACLADDFEVKDDQIVATNLQIINGAQTVRSLHKAFKSRDLQEAVKKALILVRVTKVPSGYSDSGRFRQAIVRSNNTQNVIKLSDFKSNDPIQADLKQQFARYRKEGKDVLYVPKRTDPRESSKSHVIQMEEFAKVIFSFLKDPVSFSAKTSFLFDESEGGGYLTVFGDGKASFTVMPEHEFKLRSAIWWMASEFTERLKADREQAVESIDRAALERKWFILFIARLVLQRSYGGDGYQNELVKHYKGDWKLGEERVGDWMLELYKVAKEALVFKYSEDAAKPGFIHRNWMRNSETVATLEHYVRRAPRVEIPPLMKHPC